jgi:hypothetical protein
MVPDRSANAFSLRVPDPSGIEAARLLGNEFRDVLLAAGLGDDVILTLAEDWVAEDRDGDFVAWARHFARTDA